MTAKVNTIDLEDEFRVCPLCGYKDGFHTMLRKRENDVEWLFICPACHEIFDLGYRMKGKDFGSV